MLVGTLLKVLLTHFRPMEFSIKLHTIYAGWFSVYIEGSQVVIIIAFPEDQFCLTKQSDQSLPCLLF